MVASVSTLVCGWRRHGLEFQATRKKWSQSIVICRCLQLHLWCVTVSLMCKVHKWICDFCYVYFEGKKKKKNEEGEGMKYFGNRSWGKINSSGQKLLISCASNASWRFQRHGTIVFVEKLPVTQSCIKNLSMFNTSCQFRFSKFYGKNISSVSFLSLLVPASFDCSLRLYHVSLLFFECKKVSVSSFPSQSLLH